jgi:hypothetical protein
MSISDQELEQLCAKLAGLELSDDQRRLLDAVLQIAWDFVSSHSSLDAQFDGCFEPDEAELIMAYLGADEATSTTKSVTKSITKSITKASGSASITRAFES